MTKRIMLLNLFLLVAGVYVGRAVYRDYKEFNESHKVMAVEPESAEKKSEKTPTNDSTSGTAVNPAEYAVIAEKNLFVESRNPQTVSAAPLAEVAPPLNPKPFLTGVAMVGAEPRAFIQNLRVQPGQKPTKILKLGDMYEGYKVSQINKNRVELVYTLPSGNIATQILDINDPASRAARVPMRTPVVQSQVISVGGQAGGVPGQPPAVPGQAAGVPPGQTVDEQGRRVIRTPFGDVVQGAGGQAGAARPPQVNELAKQGQQLLQQEQQLLKQTPQRRNEIIDEQGRRIIRTPFGDIVRPPDTQPPPPQY